MAAKINWSGTWATDYNIQCYVDVLTNTRPKCSTGLVDL